MYKLLLAALVATPAMAQEVEPEPTKQRYKFKEREEIDFDGVEVKGATTKPSLSWVKGHEQPVFNPLIKLRSDFSTEMEQSVDEVK